MIKYLELALSQEVYEYLEELDQMNWSARGNVLNQYLSNTSIGTTVRLDYLQRLVVNLAIDDFVIEMISLCTSQCKSPPPPTGEGAGI